MKIIVTMKIEIEISDNSKKTKPQQTNAEFWQEKIDRQAGADQNTEESPDAVKNTIKDGNPPPKAPNQRGCRAAAAEFLRQTGTIAHYTTIAKEMRWTSPKGKTPERTLNAEINRDIKRNGRSSCFISHGNGRYSANLDA